MDDQDIQAVEEDEASEELGTNAANLYYTHSSSQLVSNKVVFSQQTNKGLVRAPQLQSPHLRAGDFAKSSASSSQPSSRSSRKSLPQNENKNSNVSSSSFVSPLGLSNGIGVVLNSDNHYERQYACKRCDFFTNNPRAVLYHRKEFHMEKINVHECTFCQYASQYSGKVERHTMLRHKIDVSSASSRHQSAAKRKSEIASVQEDASPLDKSSNSLALSESFVSNNRVHLLMNQSAGESGDHQQNYARSSQYQTYQTRNLNNSFAGGAKFQCNKCPCKYKRSSDLSKHLKLKHSIHATNLRGYLTTATCNVKSEGSNGLDEEAHSNGDLCNYFFLVFIIKLIDLVVVKTSPISSQGFPKCY